ncbi:FadR/GntR family transcriptional regulator [Labrys wisconsinensis]|uniref:GntR family transcriptional repressor for pyruvate dehydrogenase complex n=1 Tax=Labrys wisconsinensis TaxID=425677 RepID=A0ABU0J853_9HYPH|nr:FadR/GntR family transcriptional regulator [Labrys wisconsinensis]MDQ0469603.1 GntR family transcriptional repressor for pyruvate dehydrogenase complex [Labrys wisconsinensis]
MSYLDKIVPISRKPAAERVASQLLELIRSGNIKPGEVFPTEGELAEALHVSRPVVREALRGLQILGVVESRQGGRCSVTDLEISRLLAPLQFVIGLNESNLDALYQARLVNECGLIRLCAARVTEAELAQLRDLVAAGYRSASDPTAFRVVDQAFHHLLMRIGANPFMESVAKGLYELGMDYRRVASETAGVIERSAEEHAAIVEALARHDGDAAAEAMRVHLASINRTTLEAMRRIDGAPTQGD